MSDIEYHLLKKGVFRMKSIRFLCEEKLLSEVDAHRSRFVCRTAIIEAALKHYLKTVKNNDGRLNGVNGWMV